jgi:tetratricopeptide (TPR) repeat protein
MKWQVLAEAAIFIGLSAGTALAQLNGDQFDYFSRCADESLSPAKRIPYCRHLIGSGKGVEADNQIRMLIAQALRDDGQYSDALAMLNEILLHQGTDFGDMAYFYEERGTIYALEGQYEQAITDADKVIELAPDAASSYDNRCWVRAIAGRDLAKALADCEEALKRSPGLAAILDSRGLVHFKLNDLKAALDDYKSVMDADGRQWGSLFVKGIVEIRLGDSATGTADMTRALRHNPNLAKIYSAYGVKQDAPPKD